ncbi:hypothetical protein RI054_40g147450 [Pseudoscourfieldia marina]
MMNHVPPPGPGGHCDGGIHDDGSAHASWQGLVASADVAAGGSPFGESLSPCPMHSRNTHPYAAANANLALGDEDMDDADILPCISDTAVEYFDSHVKGKASMGRLLVRDNSFEAATSSLRIPSQQPDDEPLSRLPSQVQTQLGSSPPEFVGHRKMDSAFVPPPPPPPLPPSPPPLPPPPATNNVLKPRDAGLNTAAKTEQRREIRKAEGQPPSELVRASFRAAARIFPTLLDSTFRNVDIKGKGGLHMLDERVRTKLGAHVPVPSEHGRGKAAEYVHKVLTSLSVTCDLLTVQTYVYKDTGRLHRLKVDVDGLEKALGATEWRRIQEI